ncbi:SRPBCC family protein [Phytoactinopolyspora limicola]|uniref:SRPBCC family protein n=1 Tax=Phytoactinopolyspora limicola TaxID=2715536 RepID=UPI00140D2A96|nr:SRPBCC family protein [Phytoactinopolyspora limicola]
MIDQPNTEGQLDAVERGLGITEKDEATAIVSTISQVYATTVEDLWDACTNTDRLPRWFAPVSGDLQRGGRYQVENNAGGTVTACDPPKSFSATWEYGESTSDITVRIEQAGDGARLTLEHRGDVPKDFWATYGPGATGVGWDLAFLGLALHITTGAPRPPESDEWVQTDQYRQFVAEVSRRWADASVAAGMPESDARGAEARTTAFYRGDEVAASDESQQGQP